jgi:peptide/nickel transport system permease protein
MLVGGVTHGGLIDFVLRRLLALAALMVVVSFVVFSLLHLAPGNPVNIVLGDRPPSPEAIRALRHEYHLDKPFLTQYWIWIRDAAHLSFGNSVQTSLPVADEIRARLPVSLFLGAYAFALTMMIGVGLGTAAGLKKRTTADRGIVALGVVGLSTPVFVSGVFLLYLFAVVLKWFPAFGRGSGFVGELTHLTLPAIALTLHSSAYVLKHTRAGVINVLDQDYVTFARARGLSSRRILFVYTLRNALIPIVTISGIILALLVVGAVIVEVTFSVPGIGDLLVQSASNKDLPMLQGVAMLIAVVILAANMLADLAYAMVDPRIRLGRSRR